jgi:predicted transcriptional regulator YdeE
MANSQLNTNDASVAQLQTARFEHGPALLIAGLREQYPKNTINTLAGVLNLRNDAGGSDYLAGVEVSEGAGLSPQIPPQCYAVFAHSEHVSTLNQTVAAIFQRWTPGFGP